MFQDIIRKVNERRTSDYNRYHKLNANECQLCGARGPDKRSFFVKCMYDHLYYVFREEPFRRGCWYLLVCKSCRGELLMGLRDAIEKCESRRDLEKDSDGRLD